MSNPHTDYLRRFQDWRTGKDERTMEEAGLTPKEIGIAIEAVLALVDTQGDALERTRRALEQEVARVAELEQDRELLFSGYEVSLHLTSEERKHTSVENVAAVLNALVRAMKHRKARKEGA